MEGNHDKKYLDALRERLYSRGEPPKRQERTKLTEVKREVPTTWKDRVDDIKKSAAGAVAAATTPVIPRSETQPPVTKSIAMNLNKGKYSYRVKILLVALFFFVAAVILSSLFIVFGGNTISGENIRIEVSGPFTVAGGGELPLQVGITNQNSVPIESATLIVEYPTGTQSIEEEGRELFIERIALDAIRSGETVNVPLKAMVFGEENTELTVDVSIEYRVENSNATFYKEAEPFRFKIGSSPVSLEVESVRSVSSGQEIEVKLAVRSNAPAPLRQLLVKAEYPSGFDFTSASPSPVSEQDTWLIEELPSEGTEEIVLKGVVIGNESDEGAMRFSIGVPNERDRYALASVFGTASSEFVIEEPFLDVSVSVGGETGGEYTIEPGESTRVQVAIENTLDEAIYDGEITAELSGNALSESDVRVDNGFYDSNTNSIVWTADTASDLRELDAGASETFSFSFEPSGDALRTPQINLEVSVHASRVRESNAAETLVGLERAVIRIASAAELDARIEHAEGSQPPQVGDESTYTVSFSAGAGSNDLAGAQVTASLPQYVSFEDTMRGDGSISYSAANRTVTWQVGDIEAQSDKSASFEVSFTPSVSQENTAPRLVDASHLRAEDRFTGTVVRATSPALSSGERVEND